jgi:hypothetical protein
MLRTLINDRQRLTNRAEMNDPHTQAPTRTSRLNADASPARPIGGIISSQRPRFHTRDYSRISITPTNDHLCGSDGDDKHLRTLF